jgi:septal ring factor EnvC (AmiA/AmiB activator)
LSAPAPQWLRGALFSLVLVPFCAAAAKEDDLRALRDRIEQLSAQLDEKEESRKEARDALRASERAISEANRSLAALEKERQALREQAARIAARRQALERSLAERQAAIERMLVARAAGGGSIDALRVALSGEDPATLDRRLHYTGYVSRAAASMLAEYRAGIAESERLARDAEERRSRLRSVEQSSRAGREKILAERREKKRVFERIAGDIRASRREIKVLRADESRLGRLVRQIGRILVERVPESDVKRQLFSSLRGKLRLPVLGELTGRFGAPRGAAGSEAKGVFIRAPEGQPVRAIAGGQVVYADWMRGFGNLLIVDHGETYLSIYANNEALLKQIGEGVSPGETIATTGASGGNEETGLYFELRHLGKAFDPLRWVKLK